MSVEYFRCEFEVVNKHQFPKYIHIIKAEDPLILGGEDWRVICLLVRVIESIIFFL